MTVPLILKWEEPELKEIIFAKYIYHLTYVSRNLLNTKYSKNNSTIPHIKYGVIFINWIKSNITYPLPALKVCNE